MFAQDVEWVKTNVGKLLFYAHSKPEKLDLIGKYFVKLVKQDLSRRRYGWVRTTVSALDEILLSFSPPSQRRSLNLFIDSFLAILKKLMTCEVLDLQIEAVNSFIKFADTIDEDTQWQRMNYDFFLNKFISMCFDSSLDPKVCNRTRMAGLAALLGVMRNATTDDLKMNIWDEKYMDKIVLSLIYNMQQSSAATDDREGRGAAPVQHMELYSFARGGL